MPDEPSHITLKFSNFLKYTLGSNENFPLEYEDALVIKHTVKQTAVHVQLEDIKTKKPFLEPIMWNRKYWMNHLERIQQLKVDSELRRKAVDKNRDSLQNITKFLKTKYMLPAELATTMASQILVQGNREALENILGIKIEHLTAEEQKALGDYWRIM